MSHVSTSRSRPRWRVAAGSLGRNGPGALGAVHRLPAGEIVRQRFSLPEYRAIVPTSDDARRRVSKPLSKPRTAEMYPPAGASVSSQVISISSCGRACAVPLRTASQSIFAKPQTNSIRTSSSGRADDSPEKLRVCNPSFTACVSHPPRASWSVRSQPMPNVFADSTTTTSPVSTGMEPVHADSTRMTRASPSAFASPGASDQPSSVGPRNGSRASKVSSYHVRTPSMQSQSSSTPLPGISRSVVAHMACARSTRVVSRKTIMQSQDMTTFPAPAVGLHGARVGCGHAARHRERGCKQMVFGGETNRSDYGSRLSITTTYPPMFSSPIASRRA